MLSRAEHFRGVALVVGLALLMTGCWEQVSPTWFAQMKEQPAVQALEHGHAMHGMAPLVPPAGTIPITGLEPRIDSPVPAFMPQAMSLANPIPTSTESVARGEELYGIYCTVCHGVDGNSNAEELPVAKRMAEGGMPPVSLVAVPAYTDGFLFTKIRYGKPGMPAYPQIEPEDRWHIVNYLRVLKPKN